MSLTILTAEAGQDLTDEAGQPLIIEDGQPVTVPGITPRPLFVFSPPRASPHSSQDYASALHALLPTGRVWPREADSTQAGVVAGIAPTWARNDARAFDLLEDSPSGRLNRMLPDWEDTLGLPDPCSGELPTFLQRVRLVRAKIASRGGQSAPYLIEVAAALGFAITITEFTPSRFGRLFGLPFGGEPWAHTWQVNVAGLTVEPFLFGSGRFGEPFRTWGSVVLQCTLDRIKPAHTVLQFAYGNTLA